MANPNPFVKLAQEKIDEIVRLRKVYRMNYSEIAREVGVMPATVKKHVEWNLGKKEAHIVRSRLKKPKPDSIYTTKKEYAFLKYIRPTFKWAKVFSGLSRAKIELLLYLYDEGTFTKRKFNQFHKIIAIYEFKTFDELIKKGFIVMWRDKKKNQSALYALTERGKIMCAKMHKILIGEMDVPETAIKTLSKSDVRMDGYYMNVIKTMNKERKLKQKNE